MKFIITVNASFVRDAQVATETNALSEEELYENLYTDCELEHHWTDYEGEIFLGIEEGKTPEEAIQHYSSQNPEFDPRILNASPIEQHCQVYTHDVAAQIIEEMENLLIERDIRIPSPEDDEREEGDTGLYGSVYSDLLDNIEDILVKMLSGTNAKIIEGIFSGN